MPKHVRPAIDRFTEKYVVNADTGCWEWIAFKNPKGYGTFKIGSRTTNTCRAAAAHRFSYEHYKGAIPEGLQIDHLCRVRHCVNPEHLEAVTGKENNRRGIASIVNSARMKAITHCPQGHEYNEENTYIDPSGGRRCRSCARARKISNREQLNNYSKGK